MTRGIPTGSHLVVATFYTTLLHQLLALFCVGLLAVLAWNALRTIQYRRAVRSGDAERFRGRVAAVREPLGRAVLRWGFGLIWLLDGLLQLQSSMPLGMPSGVLSPAASGSPGWVVRLVSFGVEAWSRHPVTAAAATVWIQCGLGVLLLCAPRGRLSRLAGVASAGWGLIVWSVGEAFGGLFSSGTSVLFGFPGAALAYVVAGVLLMLPESAWRSGALGRRLLQSLGAFLCLMAVLQALPGRGFWQGHATKRAGAGLLDQMIAQMSTNAQPGWLQSLLHAFGRLDDAHGFGVNLAVVIVLATLGLALLSGRRRLLIFGAVGAVAFALADWVFVQDLGFLGGVGTDPNSMPPLAVLVGCGTVAVLRPSAGAPDVLRPAASAAGWLDRATPTYLLQLAAGAVAAVVVLVGATPMALAAASSTADPILASALGDTPQPTDFFAPGFTLVNQHGQKVSLASERHRVVVLTFLDPVCTSDCPLIAQELAAADRDLGTPSDVAFLAVNANPLFRSIAALRAFDEENSLTHLANWSFLTGSLPALSAVWRGFDVTAEVAPAGAMIDHTEIVFVIDRFGVVRDEFEPSLGSTSAEASSFGSLLAESIRHEFGS